MTKISNPIATVYAPSGNMNVQVCFNVGTTAYDFWLNEENVNRSEVLYKRAAGSDVRQLDSTNATNAPLVAAAMAAIDLQAARTDYVRKMERERIEREQEEREEAAKARRALQADQALELLQRYMNICGHEPKPLYTADLAQLATLWEESNQVLIAAGV